MQSPTAAVQDRAEYISNTFTIVTLSVLTSYPKASTHLAPDHAVHGIMSGPLLAKFNGHPGIINTNTCYL